MYRKYLKRALDILISTMVLTAVFPLFFLVAGILFIQNGGSIFFYQERPGLQEKPFKIIKFKTMTDEKDEAGNLLPDMERITVVGQWIRKLSLDELPQLINVLKGEMSLIGPRPLLFRYIPLYSEEQKKRHNMRPGITGWAQVNGRNSISWSQKFKHDLYYVEHVSFRMDVKIFWLTILKIIKREGINQSSERPMQPFNGYN